jgi:hypothetical protein
MSSSITITAPMKGPLLCFGGGGGGADDGGMFDGMA